MRHALWKQPASYCKCKFSGLHSGVVNDSDLLWHDQVSLSNHLPTFQGNTMPSESPPETHWAQEDEGGIFVRNVGNYYPVTQGHIKHTVEPWYWLVGWNKGEKLCRIQNQCVGYIHVNSTVTYGTNIYTVNVTCILFCKYKYTLFIQKH
jgi:hypothetical protein